MHPLFPPKARVPAAVLFIAVFLQMPAAAVLGGDAPVPPLLVPPKADEIAGFGDDMVGGGSTGEIIVSVGREKVMEFLAKGAAHPMATEWAALQAVIYMSRPYDVLNSRRASEGRGTRESGRNAPESI